ncbi:MAG TPA: M20/M25/M40 family metallo-hydrolase, partial [Gemmatimonadales bacterium]|nr:M20/M25/M40 family metallo-hydrolase [Gemmatimonadales bacterium]
MTVRRSTIALSLLLAAVLPGRVSAQVGIATAYRAAADSLIRGATADSSAYRRLGRLVDTFGSRLSGSPSLEAAIDWVLETMKTDGLENVRGEPVMVPRWVRGAESAELVRPRRARLAVLGLGGSVGTAARGITAPVLVVGSLEELARRAAEAKGRIVLLDVPFTEYTATRHVRTDGPSAAARAGAVACLIRSVATFSMRNPHTGVTLYDSTAARIPAAALSVEDAMMLHRLQDRGEPLVVTLRMGAHTLPDAPSRNVVAEIVGREKPDEVVVLGGHIDSWDVGQGAMDDGGGSVAAWEAVRLLKRLGLRPRRTVRVVLWTNEENGGRGAEAYAKAHAGELSRHVLAMESDNGVFNPRGYVLGGSDSAAAVIRQVAALMQPIGATGLERVDGSPAADTEPLAAAGIPAMELDVDGSRYFWY